MRIIALAPPTFDVGTIERVQDADSLRRAIVDSEVLVLAPRYGSMIREVWPDAKKLRWIHSLGAGVETLPFDLLRESDVIVTNSKGIYADALAEWVVAAMMWFAKDLRRLAANQANAKWEPFAVQRLEGATLGIIGYGSVGETIAKRARPFDMRILTSRRTGGTPINDLLAASDFVVLCTPLTSETRHLIDAGRLARMRESAVLINISRGPVVDEAALIEALKARRIRGAALDVFETEPLPAESPLWSLDNVLLSPHSADHATDAHARAIELFHSNLGRFQRDEALENVVDKMVGYGSGLVSSRIVTANP